MLKGGLVLIWELDMNLEPTLLLKSVEELVSSFSLFFEMKSDGYF